MSIRVLLCGAGGYGENYLKEFLYEDVQDATLVAIADPFIINNSHYDEVSSKKIALYDSPQEAFKEHSFDLTIISSPIHTHYSYTMLALDNKSNVLLEKPVCFETDQIEEMQKKSQDTGLFVSVGYQLCFCYDILALKKDILSGLYGKAKRMKTLRLMRRNDIYYSRSSWAGAFKCQGQWVYDSPFSNACAHQYQNMVFLLGPTMEESTQSTKVEGSLYRVRPTIENSDTAILKFTTIDNVELYYYSSHAVDETKIGPIGYYEFENGYVEETEEGFIGHLDDKIIDYTKINRGKRLEKLYECIRCAKEQIWPLCTLKTSFEHTHAVLLAQKNGVIDLSSFALAKKDDKDSTYYTINSLSKTIKELYAHWSVDMKPILKGDSK